MIIRPASEADLAGILVIYNDVVRTSSAVYTEEEANLENRLKWYAERCALGYPVLVADDESNSRDASAVLAS